MEHLQNAKNNQLIEINQTRCKQFLNEQSIISSKALVGAFKQILANNENRFISFENFPSQTKQDPNIWKKWTKLPFVKTVQSIYFSRAHRSRGWNAMLATKIRILQRHEAFIYDPIRNVSGNKFSIGILP